MKSNKDFLKQSILKAYQTFLEDIPVKKERKGKNPYLILGHKAYNYLMSNSKRFRTQMIEDVDYKIVRGD